MEIIPFGEVVKERLDEARKYQLIENVGGIWRLTEKCKRSYEPTSYIRYLQGKVGREGVVKVQSLKTEGVSKVEKNKCVKHDGREEAICSLLSL